MSDVTRILAAIENGDAQAADELLSIVYEKLRRLASHRLARESPQTLQPTDLVHEAYLRLVGGGEASGQNWDSRAHFFAAAAEAMRRILIDRARRKARPKHGGGRKKLDLREEDLSIDAPSAEILSLDEALTKLAAEDGTKAELVKLRYFAGLSLEDTARLMGISKATADRYWAYARAWLYDEMTRGDTAIS